MVQHDAILENTKDKRTANTQQVKPPIHLHLIFEISSLKNLVLRTGFYLVLRTGFFVYVFRTRFLQATQAVKI